jgi:hypothetical protein
VRSWDGERAKVKGAGQLGWKAGTHGSWEALKIEVWKMRMTDEGRGMRGREV